VIKPKLDVLKSAQNLQNLQNLQNKDKDKDKAQNQGSSAVTAQPEAKNLQCPAGNLLLQKKPIPPTRGIQRSLRMTDGAQVAEGSFWEIEQASILRGTHQMVIDLGVETTLRAFLLQADNNDSYHIYGSLDEKNYFSVWEAKPVSDTGLRTRTELKAPSKPLRYLKISATGGDGSYSITEVQAYCQKPEQWPPKLPVNAAVNKEGKDDRKYAIGRGKIAVALYGLLFFFIPLLLKRTIRQAKVRAIKAPKDQNLIDQMIELWQTSTPRKWIAYYTDSTLILFSILAPAGFSFFLSGYQIKNVYDILADNGALKAGLWAALENITPTYAKWTFINSGILFVVGLWLLLWGLVRYRAYFKHFKNTLNTVKSELLAQNQSELTSEQETQIKNSWLGFWSELQLIGLIGMILTVMTQSSEQFRQHFGWYFEGWEVYYIGAFLTLTFIFTWRFAISIHQKLAYLVLIALFSFSWMGFGAVHGNRLTHFWDTYHYYMGSKYFAETRYHLMYHCAILAELDDGLDPKELDKRELRDLRTNMLGNANIVLDQKNPLTKECRSAFAADPERWEAFKQDIRLFKGFMASDWWNKMFRDHGYNASPVWNMLGGTISQWNWAKDVPDINEVYTPKLQQTTEQRRVGYVRFHEKDKPRFEREILNINRIDLALLFVAFMMFMWAFGLETTAVALFIFALGYPWTFDWTGGSMLRFMWISSVIAGFALLKKNYHGIAGICFAWALLERIFPGALVGGIAVQILAMIFKKTPWQKSHIRFTIGALLTIAILIPLGYQRGQGVLPEYQGWSVYKEFTSNTLKHNSTPLTNHMGFRTLLSYHPKYLLKYAKPVEDKMVKDLKHPLWDKIKKYHPDRTKHKDFSIWRTMRHQLKYDRMPIFLLTLGVIFWMFYRMRKREMWEITALSAIFVVWMVELTCYYYNFLALLAPLVLLRARSMFWMILLLVTTQWVQISVGWIDEEYLWESLIVVLMMLIVFINTFEVYEEEAETQNPELPSQNPELPSQNPT
jgi:hypothetical protein